MEKKDLVSKLKSLQEIKPESNWVSLTRSEIFDKKEKSFSEFLTNKFFVKSSMTAFASLGLVAFLVISAQGAYPGDTLYPVKRMTEKGKMAFLSQEAKQDFNLLLTQKRLEEVSEMVKRNQIEQLSLAVEELESVKSKIEKGFARSVENKTREEVVAMTRDFAPTLLEIEDEKEMLLGPLGVRVERGDSSDTMKDSASFLIKDLEERDLTEKDELLLQEAKDLFEEKNYRSSLKTVLQVGQGPLKNPDQDDDDDSSVILEEDNNSTSSEKNNNKDN